MTLTDPRETLADRSDFIGYLIGLAGVGDVVRTLAADGDRGAGYARDPDDFVHVLLGLASVGTAIERLTNSAMAERNPTVETPRTAIPSARWLR